MKRFLKTLLILLSFLTYSEEQATLCLYTPNIPVKSFKKLKIEYGEYFTKQENLYFQPFASKDDFEKYVADKKNFMAIIPGCQLKAIPSCDKLQTLFYGVSDKESDEKFFIISQKNKPLDQLKKIHIATSLDEQIVGDIISRNKSISKDVETEILPVSKDLDALMSLTFNVFEVDVAIVSEKVYNLYSKRNESFSAELAKTDSGFCAKRTIVIAPKDCPKTLHKKSQILTRLNKDAKGRDFMTFLSLDSWAEYKEPETMEESNEK